MQKLCSALQHKNIEIYWKAFNLDYRNAKNLFLKFTYFKYVRRWSLNINYLKII